MNPTTTTNKPTIVFYYDVVCPWAYIGSKRIDAVAADVNATIVWTPVLLGGIYKATAAPQGKDGSATDVMPLNKRAIHTQELVNTLDRFQVPLQWHPNHPLRSINAGRLLHAVVDNADRRRLTHRLYKAYWVENLNVSDPQVLLSLVSEVGLGPSAFSVPLGESLFSHESLVKALTNATAAAVAQGAPGVPAFYLPKTSYNEPRLYWGGDRLHFVATALAGRPIAPERAISLRSHPTSSYFPLRTPTNMAVFVDFSSPWAFIGWSRLKAIQELAGPLLKIELVPILLGALFKTIGTPNVPMLAISATKREYGARDMDEWCSYWNAVDAAESSRLGKAAGSGGINLRFPDEFPIRSVTALRVAILEPKTFDIIYRSAWERNVPIANEAALAECLTAAGFPGTELVARAKTDETARQTLRENGERALRLGLCGVPTFVLGEGSEEQLLAWGQDRLDVVTDYLAGWRVGGGKKTGLSSASNSKL
ncbi:thioredoxin-like protein [Zopfochytrium polystomum]|nr:thioredoxin-like protein [Zopfochytrium polystomum]